MKAVVTIELFFLAALTISGCSTSRAVKQAPTQPAFFIQPDEAIAVMPFETESALSNLGAQVSDEVIVNLLQYRPELKIVHAPVVRNYQLNTGSQSEIQKVRTLPAELQCRYLLTGNLFTQLGNVNYPAAFNYRIATGSVTVLLVDCDSSYVIWAKRVNATYSTQLYNSSTYQTDGELLQGLIRALGAEVAKNFYEH